MRNTDDGDREVELIIKYDMDVICESERGHRLSPTHNAATCDQRSLHCLTLLRGSDGELCVLAKVFAKNTYIDM